MIPILFDTGETRFKSNGLGRLSDALSCKVTEERNGSYELEMTYPIDGIHYSDISYGKLIFAKPAVGADPQPFEIYLITRPMNGQVSIRAEHISYRLKYIPCAPFTANDVSGALQGFVSHAVTDCPFTFSTNKTTTGEFEVETPASIRSFLADGDDTIQNIYGGEWEFDKFDCRLWKNRGAYNGVIIEYGKNLTSLEQEENIEDMVTAVYPFWKKDSDKYSSSSSEDDSTISYGKFDDGSGSTTEYVSLPEKVVYTSAHGKLPYERVTVLDLSSDLESKEVTSTWTETKVVETVDPSTSRVKTETKTEEHSETYTISPDADSLRKQAEVYIGQNHLGVPKVSLKVGFVDLYGDSDDEVVRNLKSVHLCDLVTVNFSKLGVATTAEVTKTEFDVLTERYTSIEIGELKTILSDMINNRDKHLRKESENETASFRGRLVDTRNEVSQVSEKTTQLNAELEALKEQAKYSKGGSKSLTLSASTDAILFTMAELDTLFGLNAGTCNNKNTVVSAVNADEKIKTPITGCVYNASAWHVNFAAQVTGTVLVNYSVRYIVGG